MRLRRAAAATLLRRAAAARLRRRAAGAIGAMGCALLPWLFLAPSAAAQQPGPHTVAVSVLDVSTISLAPSATPQDITVRLELTNTSPDPLDDLSVVGVRGNPIANQDALDAAIATPGPPDPTLAASFGAKAPVTVSLPPGATRDVEYVSTFSTSPDGPGLCVCENRVYPLYFAVHATVDGGDVIVGSGQTFVVSFPVAPTPIRVGWLWPMLEPPHRATAEDVFTDDSLAASVADGRLSRLLDVVEAVDDQVPMTLVVDPDLIDELAVMASGKYTVLRDGKRVAGAGTAAAKDWLARLRAVLAADPGVQLAVTPPANPDVSTLAESGLDWSARPSATAQARVAAALGGAPVSTLLSWPAREALTGAAATELARSGVSAAVLSPAAVAVPEAQDSGAVILSTDAGDVRAAVPAPGVAAALHRVLPVGGAGAAALPQLVAQLAVHAISDPQGAPFLAVVPPADLDPDPTIAARAILATAGTVWATGVPLRSGTADDGPRARLAQSPVRPALPRATLTAAHRVAAELPGLTTLFEHPQDAGFGQLAQAVQRSESAAWLDDPAGSAAIAAAITAQLNRLQTGVHVVRPANGTYTLGSDDSPLPVTLQNSLAVPVRVRLSVTAVGGIPGFTATDLGVQQLAAGAKLALHVPVHVDRAGRIKVQVQLLTPAGTTVGAPVVLSVRSTALGEIGKVITAVAAAVLALALLARLARGIHRHRKAAAER